MHGDLVAVKTAHARASLSDIFPQREKKRRRRLKRKKKLCSY